MDVDGWMDPSSSPRHGPKATKPLSESRVIPLAVISLDFLGFPMNFRGLQWISLDFPLTSVGFTGFPWISYGFPWISLDFLGIPMDFR